MNPKANYCQIQQEPLGEEVIEKTLELHRLLDNKSIGHSIYVYNSGKELKFESLFPFKIVERSL